MANGDVLINRAVAMGDGFNVDHLALARAETVAGELAKRTLFDAVIGPNFGFENDLGMAGASKSMVSQRTSSRGSPNNAPMMPRSSSSIEPIARQPSAIAGCTPIAKTTGNASPRASANL